VGFCFFSLAGLGETEEATRGDLREIALLKFLLDAIQVLGQSTGAGLTTGYELFLQGFQFEGALILNFELQLAA